MKRTLFIVVIACIVLMGIIVLKYASGDGDDGRRGGFSGESADGRSISVQPAPVRVEAAFVGELVRRVTSSGTTEAVREEDIKSQITAPVKQVHVDVGKRVSKRDLLVELDDQEYRLSLQEANAKLMNARLEYALMKKEQLASVPVVAVEPAAAAQGAEPPRSAVRVERVYRRDSDDHRSRQTGCRFATKAPIPSAASCASMFSVITRLARS